MWSVLFVCAIALNLCVCSFGQTLSSGTPLYVQSIGGTHLYSGVLIAVYIISAMIGRIISGRIVDAKSRRFVMIAGSSVVVFGSILPTLVPIEGMLFVSRLLQGLGFASAQTAIGAFVADALPFKRMGEGIGYFGLGQAVAMALGPAFAVWLVGLEYSEALSVGLGSIGAVMLVISFFIRYEKNPRLLPKEANYRVAMERKEAKSKGSSEAPEPVIISREAELSVAKKPSLFDRFFERSARYGAIPALFFSMTASIFVSYTTAFAQDSGYVNVSIFFVVAAVTAIVLRLFISKVMDTFNPVKLFAIAAGAGCAALLIMMIVHQEVAYYVCGVGYGVCIGIAIPLMNSIAVKPAPQERYGAANSLFFIAYDIGFGVGVIGWGLVIDLLDYNAIFVGGILCLVIALLLSARMFPKAH